MDRPARQTTMTNGLSNNEPTSGFKKIDFNEVVPGLGIMSTVSPDHGAYCCLTCKKEVYRMELKCMGVTIRPLPDCGCAAKREQKRIEAMERLERRNRLKKAYSKSIVAQAIENASFDNWQHRQGTDAAFKASRSFAETFETQTLGILLTGGVGNGKSHLARSAERYIDAQGWVTLFMDWPQLVEIAKSTFNQNNVSVADIIRGAVDADLLVFDEIGAGKLTDWEFKNLLFPIINGRSGKKTIYTTNCSMKELEKWFAWDKDGKPLDEHGRLYDRIIGNCQIVKNNGTSKRREDAEKRYRNQ